MVRPKHSKNHVIDPKTGFIENPAFPSNFSAERKILWLKTFVKCGLGLYKTCEKLGMKVETFNRHYRIDPVFAGEVEKARAEYADRLESVSKENAMNPRSVIERIFQLKAIYPDKYGEKKNNGQVNVAINIDSQSLRKIEKRNRSIDAELVAEQVDKMKTIDNQQARLPVMSNKSAEAMARDK